MRVTHYNISVEIPKMEFGNEYDIQIRDELAKLGKLLEQASRARQTIPKLQEKVTRHMENLKGIIAMRNKKQQ